MKRAFGKTPAVAAALILTMIPVLAGCRDDGDPAAHPEAALTEAADPGIEAADLAAGETVAEDEPAEVERRAFISAGFLRTVAIAADGSMWTWGRLGDNWGVPVHDRPIRIGEGYDWALASNGHIALRADGSMWGLGSPLEPFQAATGHVWIRADGTSWHGVAVRADGSLWQWGDGTGGSFSDPVRVGTRTDWIRVHQGARGAFAIDEAGRLWAWGENQFGQLGIGTQGWDGRYFSEEDEIPWMIFNAAEPTMVERGAAGWVSVSTRTSYRYYISTVAVGADGSLWRWGSGGQSGAHYISPARVGTEYGWATVASGSAFWGGPRTVMTKTDGSLWELGAHYIPVRVGSGNDWVAAVAGGGEHETHAVALKRDGSLWAWGCNRNGQIGDGTLMNRTVAIQIDIPGN